MDPLDLSSSLLLTEELFACDPHTNHHAGNVTGVALRTTEDDVRIASATADNEHEWQQDIWSEAELSAFVGKEVTIDIHDTRHGAWGWFSVDDFEVRYRVFADLFFVSFCSSRSA